jgi:two-component system CheB/CheR fusion protein
MSASHLNAAGSSPQQSAVTKSRILIVDDNRDAADSMRMLLELLGNEVYVAYDGEQAVSATAEHRPNVVFLDIGLPLMNGYDVARSIRKEPWGGAIKLIALTGWGQQDDRQRAREAGFDRHFVKPLDYELLTTVLSELR